MKDQIPDPFELGMVGVGDLKDVFGDLVMKLQFEPVRMDIWMERLEDAKHRLIDIASRNIVIFEARRRPK